MVSQRTRRSGAQSAQGSRMMEQVSRAAQHPREVVEQYPISTSLVVFGVGIGVGILLARAICEPLEEAFREPTMSERWSRSMQDAMHRYMPEVSRRIGV